MQLTYLISRLIWGNPIAIKEDIHMMSYQIRQYAKALANSWKYKNDFLHGVLNNIKPPHVAARDNSGDCDDYASHLYFKLYDRSPLLLTLICKNISQNHTMVYWLEDDNHYMINWGDVYKNNNFNDIITAYEYSTNSVVKYCVLSSYDYETGYWETKEIKKYNR
jgi:hypothetical protein